MKPTPQQSQFTTYCKSGVTLKYIFMKETIKTLIQWDYGLVNCSLCQQQGNLNHCTSRWSSINIGEMNWQKHLISPLKSVVGKIKQWSREYNAFFCLQKERKAEFTGLEDAQHEPILELKTWRHSYLVHSINCMFSKSPQAFPED